MGYGKDVLDELKGPAVELRRLIPEVLEAFSGLSKAAMADGALDVKTKELIALSIAATRQCDGCIASHARKARSAGCTDVEVAEAMGVVIMMNGGPGTVYGPRTLAAFREYADAEPPHAH
jgi:AhpD family alkylhydroperoxidase